MLRVWAAAAGLVAVAGCGGTPASPTDIPATQLLAAPTRIVADGKPLRLTAFLWRDFMPPAPSDGRPLQGVLRISAEDGSSVGAAIVVDSSWVIYRGEVWTAAVEQQPAGPGSPYGEVVVRNGPRWGPGVAVDVVVRLRDAAGSMFLLRAPNQQIEATS